MDIRQRSIAFTAATALCVGAVALPTSPAHAQTDDQSAHIVLRAPLSLEDIERDPGYRLLSENGRPTLSSRLASGYTRATCTYAGGSTKTYDWTGKNPSTCGQYYRLYINGKLVFAAQTRSGPNIWGVAAQGYTALQKWCATNSMTCGIITTVGVGAVMSLLS